MNTLWKKVFTTSCLAATLFGCISPLVAMAQPMGGQNGFGGGGNSGFNGGVGNSGVGGRRPGFQGNIQSGGFQGPASGNFNAGGFYRPPGGGRMLERLGLSQDQRTQIKKLQQTAQGQAKPLRQEMNQKRQELMQYISGPKANEQEALALQKAISERQARLSELRIKTWFQMRQMMKPEQLEQMKTQGMQPMQQPPGRKFGQNRQGGFKRPGNTEYQTGFPPESENGGL